MNVVFFSRFYFLFHQSFIIQVEEWGRSGANHHTQGGEVLLICLSMLAMPDVGSGEISEEQPIMVEDRGELSEPGNREER